MAAGIEAVTALNTHMGPLLSATYTLSALFGFIVSGGGVLILMGAREGRYMQRNQIGHGVAALFVGMLLLSVHAYIDTLTQSTLNHSVRADLMAYTAPANYGALSDVPTLVVRIAAVVGLWGVISGLHNVKAASSGQGQGVLWKGVGKMVAGVAAINFATLAEMIGNSLGATAAGFVNQLI